MKNTLHFHFIQFICESCTFIFFNILFFRYVVFSQRTPDIHYIYFPLVLHWTIRIQGIFKGFFHQKISHDSPSMLWNTFYLTFKFDLNAFLINYLKRNTMKNARTLIQFAKWRPTQNLLFGRLHFMKYIHTTAVCFITWNTKCVQYFFEFISLSIHSIHIAACCCCDSVVFFTAENWIVLVHSGPIRACI